MIASRGVSVASKLRIFTATMSPVGMQRARHTTALRVRRGGWGGWVGNVRSRDLCARKTAQAQLLLPTACTAHPHHAAHWVLGPAGGHLSRRMPLHALLSVAAGHLARS
jgi:hypothetical protein